MIDTKLEALKNHLLELGSVVVGFSGGVDSSLLLKVAIDTLGERAVAVTVASPSLPASELEEITRLAGAFGARLEVVQGNELSNPSYSANTPNRCYHCKTSLFEVTANIMKELEIPNMVIGTNLDDLGDHRPGIQAAKDHGVGQPLVDAGFTKNEIREAAHALGIDVWNKPAFACLSSRFPYGTAITEERLFRIDTCEGVLRGLGFENYRVRFHGDLVRIELGRDDLEQALDLSTRKAIISGCRAAGFEFITLDLEPFRSGRLNERLPEMTGRD